MIEFNIKRILVPVDFSPASINALDTAIAMAKRNDAALLLVNVVETTAFGRDKGAACISTDQVDEMTRNSEQELQSLQDSIVERCMVHCDVITITGIVYSSIIKMSAGQRIDMIIMGTHGASEYNELSIGSNAYKVVKYSECPVLTIPSYKKWGPFRKILFPVRPIPAALEKYEVVRKIISTDHARLKVLGLATDFEKDGELLKELASQLNEKLRDDHVEASTYFKVGKNMEEEVVKIAELMDTDLIVITASTDPSSRQFFVGRYTQFIVNHARFPVLSIKPSCNDAGIERLMQHSRQFIIQETPLYN